MPHDPSRELRSAQRFDYPMPIREGMAQPDSQRARLRAVTLQRISNDRSFDGVGVISGPRWTEGAMKSRVTDPSVCTDPPGALRGPLRGAFTVNFARWLGQAGSGPLGSTAWDCNGSDLKLQAVAPGGLPEGQRRKKPEKWSVRGVLSTPFRQDL